VAGINPKPRVGTSPVENIQSALAEGQLIRRLLKRKAVPAGRLRNFRYRGFFLLELILFKENKLKDYRAIAIEVSVRF
jgi:hypothetical protein